MYIARILVRTVRLVGILLGYNIFNSTGAFRRVSFSLKKNVCFFFSQLSVLYLLNFSCCIWNLTKMTHKLVVQSMTSSDLNFISVPFNNKFIWHVIKFVCVVFFVLNSSIQRDFKQIKKEANIFQILFCNSQVYA